MVRSTIVLALAVIAACGPGDRDTTNHVDAGLGDAGQLVIDSAPACYAGTTTVMADLAVQIEESCAIWNSLDQLGGTATVTRNGTMLTIDFSNGVVFTGTLTNNAVSLTYQHDHPFSDGCGWRATETLSGQLDPVSCDFSLTYDYVETIVDDNGGCASPCSAMADVQLDLTPIVL